MAQVEESQIRFASINQHRATNGLKATVGLRVRKLKNFEVQNYAFDRMLLMRQ